jgi:branched-subunit amino acid ABC-type transport system permease component
MEFLQLLFNGIVTGTIFSLYAISFSIIYGTAKIFHFAHGMVFTCGAYFTYLFHVMLGMNIVPSILLSMIFTSMLGMAINFIIYEPLQRRKAGPLVLLVASLGTYISLQAIISLVFTSNVRVLSAGVGSAFKVMSVSITEIQVIIIGTIISINSFLVLFFLKTEAGLSIRALGEDSELAEVFGMSPRKIKYIIFAIGSALASIAATLNALDIGTIDPNIGLEALLVCFVAIVVGGMENIPGAAAGGFIVGMISHFSIWQIEARWQQIIVYSVLIAVLLVKPEGLFKSKKERI